MLTIFCPPGETSTWETSVTINSELKAITYVPRPYNGRHVIEVPVSFFISVILPSKQGRLWESENPEFFEWLGKTPKHVIEGASAFPGEGRPPPIAPITEVAPVMVRMCAPGDTTSFSHGGVEFKIGKDRMIEVDEHVAGVLRSHGFLPA